MKIDVYDTYVMNSKQVLMHFDVLVPNGTDGEKAFEYARKWLNEIGEDVSNLKQERCKFCHSENATENVKNDIDKQGYHILKMEGCPE